MDTEILPETRPRVISRKEAKELGLTQFFTGKPCRKGHVASRMVSNRNCVDCIRDSSNKRLNGSKCLVDGCDGGVYSKGLCQSHYGALRRHANPLGRKSHYAQLTPDKVREIRRLRGSLTQDKIAEMFNVHRGTVANIHSGRTWRDVD